MTPTKESLRKETRKLVSIMRIQDTHAIERLLDDTKIFEDETLNKLYSETLNNIERLMDMDNE